MSQLPTITLAIALVLMTIFAGGSYTWATGSAAVMVAATAAMCLLGRRHAVDDCPTGSPLLRADNLIIAGLVLATLTAVPLPWVLTELFGQWRFSQNTAVAEALRQAADTGILPRISPWFCFSRNGIGTQRAVVQLSLMASCMVLAAAHTGRRREILAELLVALGSFVAALGCISMWWHPQGDTIWWMFDVPHHFPGPVACFINRNHFGGFAAMLAPVAAGIAIDGVVRRRWKQLAGGLAAFVILSAACIGSLSRGAVLAYVAGLATCVVLMAVHGRRAGAVALAVAMCMAGAIVFHKIDAPTRERLSSLATPTETLSGQYRLKAWKDAIGIWRNHPIAGTGLNSFPMVYPLYRTTSDSAYMSHAENEYVQLLAEGGLIGVTLVAFLALSLISVGRRASGGSGGAMSWLRWACVGSVATVATHAALDSALHIPLYAAVFSLLVGLTMPIPLPPSETQRGRLPCVVIVTGVLALVFGLLCRPLHWSDSLRFCREAEPAPLAKALMMAPSSWNHWFQLGRRTYTRDNPERTDFAARCLTQAGMYDLNNYRLWLSVGTFRLRTRDYAGAREAFARVRALRDWVQTPAVPEVTP